MHKMSQYSTDENLSKRIAIYTYSRSPISWADWYFTRVPEAKGSHILDVGCGNGSLWVGREQLFDGRSHIELVDQSPGMIEAARHKLKHAGENWSFHVASIDRLPFQPASFDIVMANHMLYHVSDMNAAVCELSRVVKPDGRVLASTNGIGHMRQLCEWVIDCGLSEAARKLRTNAERFGLENAAELLAVGFRRVEIHRYENSLLVPDAEPIIEYVRSMQLPDAPATRAAFKRLEKRLKEELARHNGILIDLDSGLAEATGAMFPNCCRNC